MPGEVDTIHHLPNDLGLPRILIIGGGGCGKTTIMQAVIVPTLRTFFKSIVLSAPSNRAARGFDPHAKTLHSIAGMRPQDSMRISSLHIKTDQMRKRMDAIQTHAGAWIHDEALQTSASLLHAAALRTTYAREHVYKLNTSRYARPMEMFGRISFLAFCGDHLQLPPVPKSSGLLASLQNTSDEHKAGAAMFNNMHYLFEMHTMKRFTDPVLMSILNKMRKMNGSKLTEEEWQAVVNTRIDATKIQANPEQFEEETAGWYESCYLWSVVSLACYSRSRSSAKRQQQLLLISQAVDFCEQVGSSLHLYKKMLQVPSVATTGRLPGIVCFHIGMRVRLTTQILPPWAVQDATGTIMEVELVSSDKRRVELNSGLHPSGELNLLELPVALYVKLDGCEHEFLPPLPCQAHRLVGYSAHCSSCRVLTGWILVEPITRQWTFVDPDSNASLSVRRSQLPIMPAEACPLYSLQGATCDPGLIAHFVMPRRADDDIKWLIVYVMLSRVRSLSSLKSTHLTDKIRQIIESGPPAMVAENFEKLFRDKIELTHKAAAAAKTALGWQ
jgi:hypothetical protein